VAIEGLPDPLAQEVTGLGIKRHRRRTRPLRAPSSHHVPHLVRIAGRLRRRTGGGQAGFATMSSPELAGVGPALLTIVDADNPAADLLRHPRPPGLRRAAQDLGRMGRAVR
jgi:hypothetical protein